MRPEAFLRFSEKKKDGDSLKQLNKIIPGYHCYQKAAFTELYG